MVVFSEFVFNNARLLLSTGRFMKRGARGLRLEARRGEKYGVLGEV